MGSAALDALRAQIRALEAQGGQAVRRRRVPTGVPELDEVLGGLPVPGIVEISGAEGSGRARVALGIAARLTRAGRPVVWIDPGCRLYPPAAADHGVKLDQLLIVRPPEDGSAPWAWATEQILRSGCFPLVVVEFPDKTGSKRTLAHGWARAAERGGVTALVLAARPVRELPADVRLSSGGGRMVVIRDRTGIPGGEGALPAWPAKAAPW